LSVHDVTEGVKEAMVDAINRFIELQAMGGVIPEGKEVTVAALPEGMRCRHRGHLDDPDFNNVHVEIEWPGGS
jgi:hypothetical protein